MRIPAKLQEQIKGQPVAICDKLTAISGELSMMGNKTLVFTDLPAIYLHDPGGILIAEKVCEQVKLEPPDVRLQFTDQSRALSGEVAFPGGIKVGVEFRQSVAKVADMLVAQQAKHPEQLFATPLPVSIRIGASIQAGASKREAQVASAGEAAEAVESADELHADVVVEGIRLRLLKQAKSLLDVPIAHLRSTLVANHKVVLQGAMIVDDAIVTSLTIMLPSAALAMELFRILSGAQITAPAAPTARGLVAPVHIKGRLAEGELIDAHVDAILSDDELELRAMDTGKSLGRFVFADPLLQVAGTAKQFILASGPLGPMTVSGGANRFRDCLAQSETVRAAAQRTLARGAHPVFLDGEPVVCHVGKQGLEILGTAGNQRRSLPHMSAVRHEVVDDHEVLSVGAEHGTQNGALRLVGERNVLQSLFAAIGTECYRRQFENQPRELLGAIVALERDYFIYSLFGPLYEVHSLLDKQVGPDAALGPVPLPSTLEKTLALANVMAKSLEPLRNHLDKVCYRLPTVLLKGDAGICSAEPPPKWLKDQERSYRGVLTGVQPVLTEIRMLRELLLRVRGVEERKGVGSEWPLNKAQNFLAQLLAARRVGHAREQYLTG